MVDTLEFELDGYEVSASPDPRSEVLHRFYEGYDAAFILPDEKESLEGFRDCLALNYGAAHARLSAAFGSFREFVLTLHQPGGALLGGANLIAYPIETPTGPALCGNLNYIYVSAEHRQRGHLRRILAAADQVVRSTFPETGEASAPIRFFIEINDPFQMSAAAYAEDSAHTGLDQIQRIAIWGRFGAKIIDFPYIQPALSHDQRPDKTLLYGVLGHLAATLSSCLLHQHLLRFFGISVLKGRAIAEDPTARGQLEALASRCADGDLPLDLISLCNFHAVNIHDISRELRSGSFRDFVRSSVR